MIDRIRLCGDAANSLEQDHRRYKAPLASTASANHSLPRLPEYPFILLSHWREGSPGVEVRWTGKRMFNNTGLIRQKNSEWLANRATGSSGRVILIVEDSESDIFFLLRAFSQSSLTNPVFVVRNGAEAISWLNGSDSFRNRTQYPLPSIVFLDLSMPVVSGYDVLRWKQEQTFLPQILWVAVSNADTPEKINAAYHAGASAFLPKPLSAHDIEKLLRDHED